MRLAFRPAAFTLGALCSVLGALFVYACVAPLPVFDLPAIHLPQQSAPSETAPFVPPPLASFAAINARPLFSPARQRIAPSDAPAKTAAPPPLPAASLVGVILDTDNKLALLKSQGAPFAASIPVGGMLGAWQVTEITADHVVLRAGTFEHVLRMNDARRGPGAMPPAGAGQP